MIKNFDSTIHLLIMTSLLLITFWMISADSVIADDQTCQPSGGKVGISISSTELQKTASGSSTATVMVCWSDNAFDKPAIVVLMAAKTGESVNTDEEVNNHKKASWSLAANAAAGLKTYEWDYSGSGATDRATSYVLTVKAFDAAADSSGHHPYLVDQFARVSVNILPAAGTGDGTGTEDDQTADGSVTGVGTVVLEKNKIGDLPDLYDRIIQAFRFLCLAAAIIGVIYGGIKIMEAAGNPDAVKQGRTMIQASLVGLILAIFTPSIINAAIETVNLLNK